MDLNKIVDVVLDGLYVQNRNNFQVSQELLKAGIPFDSDTSEVICDKLEKLPYFDVIKLASMRGSDLIVQQNAEGHEFIQEHGGYSKFVTATRLAERKNKRSAELGARGSFWSGVGSVIAIPLSLASFVYTCQKDQKQERNIQTISDSLRTTVTRLTEVEKSIQELRKLPARKDLDSLTLKKN